MFDEIVQAALAWAEGHDRFDGFDLADYRTGYGALLRLFSCFVDVADYEKAFVGALAVYGWMPTIPQEPLSREFWERSRDALALLRASESWAAANVTLEQRPELLRLVNGSGVGTSKFLHFLNPNVFPIWDSRIARCFNCRWQYQYDQPAAYIEYASGIARTIAAGVTFPVAFEEFCGDVGVLRKLEFLLYIYGRSLPR